MWLTDGLICFTFAPFGERRPVGAWTAAEHWVLFHEFTKEPLSDSLTNRIDSWSDGIVVINRGSR